MPGWNPYLKVPEDEPGDDVLLSRMLRGDADAFAALYRRRQGPVYRFALHMSGSEATAEDVTQEVFLTLMRDGVNYSPERGSLAAYLCGIVRNLVLRRIARERPDLPMPETELAASGDVAAALLREESIERVRKAVLALPPRYREVVVLCDLEELDYAAAAETLGCAVGTVRSRLYRARRLLMERLGLERSAGCLI